MELEHSIWQISLIALVAGALIGALAYRFFAPSIKHADKMKSELDDAREELNNYKAGVSQHFDKTAELVNDLAHNYVKVYKHLAEGAETLGATQPFQGLLEQQNEARITVEDHSNAAEKGDDGLVAESVVEQEETVEPPIDYAEPVVESNNDSTDPVISESDTANSDVSESSDVHKESTITNDSAGKLDEPEEEPKKVDNLYAPDRLQ